MMADRWQSLASDLLGGGASGIRGYPKMEASRRTRTVNTAKATKFRNTINKKPGPFFMAAL